VKTGVIRLGLIGVGNFGRVLYERFSAIDGVDVVCAYHPTDAGKAARFGCRGTTDLQGLMADPDIDGVVISSPNGDHAAQVSMAMASEKHIFVEKPVTALYSEALGLAAAASSYRPVFMVGHQHRRNPSMRAVKRLIESGTLGLVINVDINCSHGGAFHFTPRLWRYHLAGHREGPLMTVGIHCVETLHYWFGPVRRVCALIKNRTRQTEAPDCNAVLMELANDAMVFMQTNYNVPSEDRLDVFGSEGVVGASLTAACRRIGRDVNQVPSRPEPISLEGHDPIVEETTEFIEAMRWGKEPETGFREGLNALAVIEACYRSSQESRWVGLDELPGYDVTPIGI
jgi:predicted dehydrogenase